eukprot:1127803-Prymnesium_polylepis.1
MPGNHVALFTQPLKFSCARCACAISRGFAFPFAPNQRAKAEMINLNASSMMSNAFSTGARPLWESDAFRHLVLANSLAKSTGEQQAQ